MTVRQALRSAARTLEASGILNGAWDAELLLRHVLGWERARLLAASDDPLPEPAHARFVALVTERARRRPLQHLTGTQAFWHHDFLVTADVLIPRPSTEHLVETALQLLRDVQAPLLVDVGTGSGCIALSLASERPDAQIHAIDVSPAALEVARANAAHIGLAGRVTFHLGDLLVPVAALHGSIDVVVSNPPYVDPADADTLTPEVRDHEPHQALFANGGQYGAYEALCPQAAYALRPGGYLLLEIGRGMETKVAQLCEAASLGVLDVRPDLQGIARIVLARRP